MLPELLYVRNGIRFDKIIDGGHQEKNKRAGTENVPGIVGMGKAIELAYKNFDYYNKKLLYLRNYFIEEVTKKLEEYLDNADKDENTITSI